MSEYPKAMKHPSERKSVPILIEGVDQNSHRKFKDYQGTLESFPPVTVNTEDQEARHRAMGYFAIGEELPKPTDYIEWPKWMKHKSKEAILVNNMKQQVNAEEKGFYLPGKPDPDAVIAERASPYVEGRVTKQYPRYENGKIVDPDAPDGKPIEYPKWVHGVLCNNVDEENYVLGENQIAALLADKSPPPKIDPVSQSLIPASKVKLGAPPPKKSRPRLTRSQILGG